MKYAALTAALVLMLAGAARAQSGRCTHEVLHVRGTPVTVGYCVVGSARGEGGQNAVQVAATYSSPHASFTQTAPMAFIPGDEPSRVIEDVALDRLGVSGTLHLTLVMQGGAVHIEAAMLTPGAITIK